MKTELKLFLLGSIFLLGLGRPVCAQRRDVQNPGVLHESSASPVNVDEILWWFPADTETVMVARGPFKLVRSRKVPLGRLLESMFQSTTVALLAGGDEEQPAVKQLFGPTILLAVEGSRQFRPPSRLGGMLFEGCQVVVFGSDSIAAGDALMKSLEKFAKRHLEIDGHRVLVSEEELENDLWTFYVSRPRPNLFLAATDEGYLREVLHRMKQRATSRALPEELREWKHVDRNARVWALRHFDRRGARVDPTSPFGGRNAANAPDEQAVGVVFGYDASQGKVIRIRYLSQNRNAAAIAGEFWSQPSEGLNPRVVQAEEGVLEISVPFQTTEALSMLFLVLSTAFGHGIFL